MPEIASRGRFSPTKGTRPANAQNHNFVMNRGAIMLLILLVLATISSVVYWRTVGAEQMARPTTHSLGSNEKQSASAVKEENSMVIESTEANAPSDNPALQADIEVNGRSISLPESGETAHHEIVENNGSKTIVDVQFDSSTTGSTVQSQSTLNLSVQSDQTSESEGE